MVLARVHAHTWLPAVTVDSIVVAAAKLAGDAALASSPLPWGTEGAAPQLPLLALPHTQQQALVKGMFRMKQRSEVLSCNKGAKCCLAVVWKPGRF